MKIRLSLVDDHNLYRKGLIKILDTFNEVGSIREFENGEVFINYYSNNSSRDDHIILLDYQMPKIDGIAVSNWIKQNKPKTKVIIISQYDDQHTIEKFIQNGASGYLLKGASIKELHEAIIQVHNNNFYFNEHVSNQMIIDLVQNKDINPDFKENSELTEREKEIAQLICREFSYKEIATQLKISQRTVETHKNNILEKIGATKITGIVVYATKQGWI